MVDCEYDEGGELDDTWINQIEEEEKEYNSFYKEPNETIKVFYTYINCENKIYHIKKDNIELNNNILDKITLLYLLKKHQNHNNISHKLISILQYNIDLEPQELVLYLKKEENFNFLSIKSNIMAIKWDDTVNLLKDLNSLHILFYESSKLKKNHTKNQTKKVFIKPNRKLKRKLTRKKT
tara:strand:+ start:1305 stop:1844 length:540 start_codon:yes stop_codon:yes gene_type:complete